MKTYKQFIGKDKPKDTITIKTSQTADSRSCDFQNVSKDTLLKSSKQHIGDIKKGLVYFSNKLKEIADKHDHDKISDIDGFYKNFITGFKSVDWYDNHKKVNRHHLNDPDGIPDDVNLLDVIEHVVDCVMAGKARTGEVFDLNLSSDILQRALKNTVEHLKDIVEVKDA